MKKLSLILTMFSIIFAFTSCDKLSSSGTTSSTADPSLVVGKWKSTSANYYEVYYADGTGKMWNEDDDVTEDEADTFTWQFENYDKTKFTQIINYYSGAANIPQMCNVVVLNETSFQYNNDGWRRTEYLKRVN